MKTEAKELVKIAAELAKKCEMNQNINSFDALQAAIHAYCDDNHDYQGWFPSNKNFKLFIHNGYLAIKTLDFCFGDMPLYKEQERIIQTAYNDYIEKLNQKLETHFELVASITCLGYSEMVWACPLNEAELLINHLYGTEDSDYELSDVLCQLVDDFMFLRFCNEADEDEMPPLEERNLVLKRCGYALDE